MSTTNQQRSSKERFWRRMVRQWRRSGLTVRAFCTEYDVSEPNFYVWRRTIAQRDGAATRFVPVHVCRDDEPTGEVGDNGLELLLGAGRVLRVRAGFDEPTLRRLLAILEEGRP